MIIDFTVVPHRKYGLRVQKCAGPGVSQWTQLSLGIKDEVNLLVSLIIAS